MKSIRTTNKARARRQHRLIQARKRRTEALRLLIASISENEDDYECGQCEGTGTIEGGLGGDGEDEQCPVCDGEGTLNNYD